MDNNEGTYTKGIKEDVIKRTDNVHTITINCPKNDEGIKCLKMCLVSFLNEYMTNNDLFENIPVPDVFICFLNAIDCCKESNINQSNLGALYSIIQTFKYLRYINFNFVYDDTLLDAYEYIKGTDKERVVDEIKKIYKIDTLEFNLCNMFTKDVVDILNKVFVFDEIISNSYLEREFLLIFQYDDYISFMEMFTSNACIELDNMDRNIIDYLLTFPKIITEYKPYIRIITNYAEI